MHYHKQTNTMVAKIGFLVNPIAGMGGKVGLKGTDGVVQQALKLGATAVAPKKAEEMLCEFVSISRIKKKIQWITCAGDMGGNELKKAGIKEIEIIYEPSVSQTSSEDTKKACAKLVEKQVDLILFCGGDGTARDVFTIVGKKIPLLGIPAGVKMHSGVFGITGAATAKILAEFINGLQTLGDIEILDLDEELYRKGEWKIRMFGVAQGIIEPTYVQVGKALFESVSDDAVKDELSEHIHDEMERCNDCLFLLGPGGTIEYVLKKMGLEKTLLGIDAVFQNQVVGKDLNEQQILSLLSKYKQVKLVLSPIGAQGFILGRGNLQLSPVVIKKIGLENIIILSAPSKLAVTPVLRVDTGDSKLDRLFANKEFFMVVIGYRLSRVVKIQTNNF